MKNLVAFVSGLIFAVGLGISGMTQPKIVRGFLDIFGQWDWRLLGVMIGAIGIHALLYRFIMQRNAPVLDSEFHLPSPRKIDLRLICGSILFGLGWGWADICPGPAIVSLASGKTPYIYFTISMLIGMMIFHMIKRKKI